MPHARARSVSHGPSVPVVIRRLMTPVRPSPRERTIPPVEAVRPLHPEAQELLERLESFGDPPLETTTPEAARALRRSRLRPPTVELPHIQDVDAGGVPARLYRPGDETGLGLLVYFHGGGWVFGDLDTHDCIARALAAESGHAVLSIDYRLAPEHPFPTGLEDAAATASWAHDHADALGCDPARLAIGGDSAGANLAAVVTQRETLPFRFQLLLYPVTDARAASATYEAHRDGPFLTAAGMHWFIEHYLSGGEGSRDDPRVSPLLGADDALAASPPTLVLTAGNDVLRDEGEAYGQRLRAVGVPTTIARYEGMFHGFVTFPEFLEDARRALAQAGAAISDALR
jgi:acetyl esterase/lipase